MKLLEPIVQGDTKISAAERWAILSSMFPFAQRDMKKQYEPTYKAEVEGMIKKMEPGVARAYVMSLLPTSCDATSLPLLNELIGKNFPSYIQDSLLVARQSNERCQKVMTRLFRTAQG